MPPAATPRNSPSLLAASSRGARRPGPSPCARPTAAAAASTFGGPPLACNMVCIARRAPAARLGRRSRWRRSTKAWAAAGARSMGAAASGRQTAPVFGFWNKSRGRGWGRSGASGGLFASLAPSHLDRRRRRRRRLSDERREQTCVDRRRIGLIASRVDRPRPLFRSIHACCMKSDRSAPRPKSEFELASGWLGRRALGSWDGARQLMIDHHRSSTRQRPSYFTHFAPRTNRTGRRMLRLALQRAAGRVAPRQVRLVGWMNLGVVVVVVMVVGLGGRQNGCGHAWGRG